MPYPLGVIMRSRSTLVLSSIVMLAAGLLVPGPSAHAITYGEPDAGEHPNVGSFVAEYTDPDTGETALVQLCTGTLIAEDVVLSAAHCFVGLPAVYGETWFTLEEVIDADRDGVVDGDVELLTGTPVPHPQFSGRANNPYDIAVFVLDEPVAGVEPAPLAPAGMFDGGLAGDEVFTAVGYGTVRTTHRTGPQGFQPGWRREKVDQELLSVTKAWVTFSMNYATGNGGTCYGDSGGPHFLGDTVVAITVTGDVPCKATDKSYRVDTPWARAFLSQFVDLP